MITSHSRYSFTRMATASGAANEITDHRISVAGYYFGSPA
jgi:hypothetical protein